MTSNGRDHRVGEIARIGGHETQPLHAWHNGRGVQQIGEVQVLTASERRRRLAPVVHGLTKQFHLEEAVLNQMLDLAHDLRHRPAPLRPPGVRHNAERAALVATLDDRHHPLVSAVPTDRLEVVGPLLGKPDCQDPLATPAAPENRIDFADPARADHEIDVRVAAQGLFALLLRDAAAEPDPEVRPLALQQPVLAQPGIGLLGRLLPHRARVQEDQIGLLQLTGRHEALLHQLARHALAVQLVHLAAPGLDVEPLHGAETTTPYAPASACARRLPRTPRAAPRPPPPSTPRRTCEQAPRRRRHRANARHP